MSSSRLLEGQVAIVTGGGRGLGRAFAERLAALGCHVGLHGMRERGPAEYGEGTTLTDTAGEIAKEYGVRAIPVLGDLTQTDHVERVVATVTKELGPIDVLVHNAGGDIAAAGGKPPRLRPGLSCSGRAARDARAGRCSRHVCAPSSRLRGSLPAGR